MVHNHHTCNKQCSHETSDLARGKESLYEKIDKGNLVCLNELEEKSVQKIFKPHDQRLDKSEWLESDVDPELLILIPFTGVVTVKSLTIIGGEGNSHPSEIRLYKNRPTMTFDDTNAHADQTFKLVANNESDNLLEYPLKASQFSSIQHLSIFIPNSYGEPRTKIYYIGLYGEYIRPFRQEITLCNYEATANPCDHKVKEEGGGQVQIR